LSEKSKENQKKIKRKSKENQKKEKKETMIRISQQRQRNVVLPMKKEYECFTPCNKYNNYNW
jgi:hypothetical protein